jgi:hypothetical protein
VVVAGFIAVGLGVAALIAIPSAAAVARSQVISYQDARPIACSNQDASVVPTPGGDTASVDDTYYSAITLTSGIDCSLRFFVTNNSLVPTRVTGVELGLLNPNDGSALSVAGINGELTSDIAPNDGPARLTADYDLMPGETQFFEMELDFAPDTMCMQPGDGGFTYLRQAPTVLVSALGIEGPREGLPGGFAMVGSDDTAFECG